MPVSVLYRVLDRNLRNADDRILCDLSEKIPAIFADCRRKTMNFMEIAENRQSCRSYDPGREVEPEKLQAILEAARLAPSACNGQP